MDGFFVIILIKKCNFVSLYLQKAPYSDFMRKIFFLFLSAIFLNNSYAQNINNVFKSMPQHILPGFSEDNRTMLLVDTGTTIIPYSLGKIEKLKHTSDYLKLKTSNVGTTQIKLLPTADNSFVICVIKTVCSKACDSNISFYNADWQQVDTKLYLPELSPDIFFNTETKNSEKYNFAVSLPDIYPVWAEFVSNSNDLALTLDYKNYLSESQMSDIEPFIKNQTYILKWDKHSFK